jgi:DNA-binding response OmpR family regulator
MFHVLLVEDSPPDVLMVREAIRTSAVMADVLIAYDGEQAIRFLTEAPLRPDIIILDLRVPKLDSFRFLRHLRANQGPPVIVFTGSVNPDDYQRAMESGACEYIVKPSDMDEFLKAVHDALGRWGARGAARSV